jgi:hypothetical protein
MTNHNQIIKYALVNALWTVLYIILIAILFNSTQSFHIPEPNVLIPVVMLLLFVFSAALTGSLILGRPILWYLEGCKSDAFKLFGYTLVVLLVVTTLIFLALFVTQ